MKSKHLKKFKLGFKQIVAEIVTGLLTSLILSLLTNAGWLSGTWQMIVNIILIVMNILLARSMLSWGVFYTVGWLIGSTIFFEIGLFGTGTWDFVLYIVLPVLVLAFRIVMTVKKAIA